MSSLADPRAKLPESPRRPSRRKWNARAARRWPTSFDAVLGADLADAAEGPRRDPIGPECPAGRRDGADPPDLRQRPADAGRSGQAPDLRAMVRRPPLRPVPHRLHPRRPHRSRRPRPSGADGRSPPTEPRNAPPAMAAAPLRRTHRWPQAQTAGSSPTSLAKEVVDLFRYRREMSAGSSCSLNETVARENQLIAFGRMLEAPGVIW